MVIQHNIMAMNAYRHYANNSSALAKNLEKLSSGYKINRAGDDAAGLAISEKMRAQISGIEAAEKNVKDGTSLVNTAEGAMQEVQDMLNRMVTLATQAANGTYDDAVDRKALQDEVNQLREEIDRIADSANFNGIKLLDGSLSTTGAKAATSIEISGNATSKTSEGAAGRYQTSTAFTAPTKMAENDTFEYTVSQNDGTSYTITLTATKDDDGKITKLTSNSGGVYDMTEGKPSLQELSDAVLAELKKTALADDYKIEEGDAAGRYLFTAKEVGTGVSAVSAADYATTTAADGTRTGGTAISVNVEQSAIDAGREIDASSIMLYNGENYDEAVFTINGHNFVVMTDSMAAKSLGASGTDMNATNGLGSDVTILISDGNKGLSADDVNFEQNIAKIAEVTGLNVSNTIKESDYDPAGTTNGIDEDKGIRLTAGKDTISGGLMLQIGDTSDSYNQLRVGIDDIHCDSLGIDKINIGTQAGAQTAINTIKNAINQVSSIRGTLGAISNRLDHTANNLSVMKENIQDAESTIRDTDVAEEMMSYTKNSILVQSAQAMLAQANQVPQGVLQLLQ